MCVQVTVCYKLITGQSLPSKPGKATQPRATPGPVADSRSMSLRKPSSSRVVRSLSLCAACAASSSAFSSGACRLNWTCALHQSPSLEPSNEVRFSARNCSAAP